MAGNSTSIVIYCLILLLSKIVDNRLNNISTNIFTRLIILQKTWFMRGRLMFSSILFTKKILACLQDWMLLLLVKKR